MSLRREVRRQTKDDQAHLLFRGSTRCVIYRGRLGSGEPSPGFVPQRDRTGASYVWVVRKAALGERDLRYPQMTPEIEAAWAHANVRMLRVSWQGRVFVPQPEEWDVLVDGPYELSTEGRLVPRVHGAADAAVPQGSTLAQTRRASLLDRRRPVAERFSRGRRLMQEGDRESLDEPRFPRSGEEWL